MRLRRREASESPLSYNKLCELADFGRPELVSYLREIYPTEARRGQNPLAGREDRKYWEVAMAARTLSDFGAADESSEVLGVGAGTERTIFWLTTRARRVFATDLYLDPGDWERTAKGSMLASPGEHTSNPWNPRRLVVQHMDALDLLYEDESFDGIFSSSSIEHFGELEDVERAADEMFRVLKPGGILSLSTEFRVKGPRPGLPNVLMFDEGELAKFIVGDRTWQLVSELDLRLSPKTRDSAQSFSLAAADVVAGRSGWSHYPHLVLYEGEYIWTSVHLALRKADYARSPVAEERT